MKKVKLPIALLLAIGLMGLGSCKQDPKQEKVAVDEEPVVLEEEVIITAEPYVIDEHHFDAVPLTDHGVKQLDMKSSTSSTATEEPEPVAEPEVVEIHTADELHGHLETGGYEQVAEVDMAIVPLDETETLLAYNKKGDPTGVLQVVTGPDGEVKKIFFADKKHRDKYDVATGMTAKEAKKLRKRLKHVAKKSDHYLYDDQSNIMYLLHAIDENGNEIEEAEVDNMHIQAIVWTDKSKHDKEDK